MVRLVDASGSDEGPPPDDDSLDGRIPFGERGRPYRVLVLGDWVVEDRWLTSAADADAGVATLHALSGRGDVTQHLAGAGAAALLLHGVESEVAEDEVAPLCEILGLGVWSRFDTRILKANFDPLYGLAKTPHRLQRPDPAAPHDAVTRVRLYDLARALPKEIATSTHRLVRRFERRGGEVVERDRVDWETPAPRDDADTPTWLQPGFDWRALEEALDSEQDIFEVDAVVVVDEGRGVVAAPLLRFVNQKCPFAEWFVETPDPGAPWLGELEEAALRLLSVRPTAGSGVADASIDWFGASGEPTREAVEALGTWFERYPGASPLCVAVLPATGGALAGERAVAGSGRADELVVVPPRAADAGAPIVAGESVVFASLVANQLRHPGAPLASLIPHAVSDVLRFDAYAREQLRGSASPLSRPQLSLVGEGDGDAPRADSSSRDFANVARSWREAARGEGVIVTASGALELQGWRAAAEVAGYVAWERGKRRALARLVGALGAWARHAEAASAAGLLLGPPGSGRRTLATRLAERFGLQFLSFDTTQLSSRRDVVDVLDAITTASLQRGAAPLLVHVDEVDARVGGETVFELFGSALERGAYARDGRAFPLARSAWLFSASGALLASADAPHWRNFVAGLSLGTVDLAGGADPAERALENVYLGARLIRDVHPEVRIAERGVLELFRHVPLDVSARELRAFIGRLTGVRAERVSLANVPAGERLGKQSVDDLLASLLATPEDEWVEIVW